MEEDSLRSSDAECRWPLICALVNSWLRPARATRKLADVGLVKAWLYHVLMVVFVIGAMALLSTACVALGRVAYQHGIIDFLTRAYQEFEDLWIEELAYFYSRPDMFVEAAIGLAVAIECLTIGIALALLPFGARKERMRSSLAHALRRVWLHTSAALPAGIVISMLLFFAEAVDRDWREQIRQEYTLKNPPPVEPDTDNAEAMASYEEQLFKYNEAKWEYEHRCLSPWYKAFSIELAMFVSILTAALALWSLARGITAYRKTSYQSRPPRCRACGYNLTGQKEESRCPECGYPVFDSLNPLGTPGVPWEHRATIGCLKAYFRTTFGFLKETDQATQKLSVDKHPGDSLFFLSINAAVCFLVVFLSVVISSLVSSAGGAFLGGITGYALFLSVLLSALLFCVAGFGAILAALIIRRTQGTNALPGTAQVASYFSGYLVICVLIASVVGVIFIFDSRHTHKLQALLGDNVDAAMGIALYAFLLITPFLYLVRVMRASKGVRYAN